MHFLTILTQIQLPGRKSQYLIILTPKLKSRISYKWIIDRAGSTCLSGAQDGVQLSLSAAATHLKLTSAQEMSWVI